MSFSEEYVEFVFQQINQVIKQPILGLKNITILTSGRYLIENNKCFRILI